MGLALPDLSPVCTCKLVLAPLTKSFVTQRTRSHDSGLIVLQTLCGGEAANCIKLPSHPPRLFPLYNPNPRAYNLQCTYVLGLPQT